MCLMGVCGNASAPACHVSVFVIPPVWMPDKHGKSQAAHDCHPHADAFCAEVHLCRRTRRCMLLPALHALTGTLLYAAHRTLQILRSSGAVPGILIHRPIAPVS